MSHANIQHDCGPKPFRLAFAFRQERGWSSRCVLERDRLSTSGPVAEKLPALKITLLCFQLLAHAEPRLFFRPLFCYSCAPLRPQVACFDNHASCPMFFGDSTAVPGAATVRSTASESPIHDGRSCVLKSSASGRLQQGVRQGPSK